MVQQLIDKMAAYPPLFIFLRRILENDFVGEKAVIRRELPINGRTLDVGCGTGELSPLFENRGYVGIDISPAYIGFAQKKYPAAFKVMDATRLDFTDSSFDNALIVGVLHHMDDETAHAVLRELHRILTPDGRLLVLEDVLLPQTHPVGRLIHRLDKGDHIRRRQDYRRLFQPRFSVQKEYLMRSGVCDYAVFLLNKA